MPKSRRKPAPPAPGAASARPGWPPASAAAKPDPRLQAANRWQRSKRYGWDSR
ncbi:MAG: hypothetical protein H6R10_1256 [Rhodocyclaceae bacterium]|nr:hypothetical protein [Rhodocyclaceae bacterium]